MTPQMREGRGERGEVRDGAGSASLSLAPVRSRAAIGQSATTLYGEVRARLAALDAAAAPADGATLADSTVGTPGVDGHQFKLRAVGGALFRGCCSLKRSLYGISGLIRT